MPGLNAAVLVVGLGGMVAQLLLLRELLITFQSNELTIGIILANWLILEAAGSYLLGRAAAKARDREGLFVALLQAFALSLPAALFAARTWRALLGMPVGVGTGLPETFAVSLLILLPVSLTHGGLFAAAGTIHGEAEERAAAGIGKVYVLEVLGTLAGGLAFSALLVTRLPAFRIALAVSAAHLAAGLLVAGRARPGGGAASPRHRVLAAVCALLLAPAAWAAVGAPGERLQEATVRLQWAPQQVVHYENSRYGNVAVVRREEQYTFFLDGVPALTAPTPDIVFAEEFAHLPLLFHGRPRSVLVLSGGAGGIIGELLKHPLDSVDYAELDPLVLSLVQRFATPLTRAELGDRRVAVHTVDGRLLLRRGTGGFDAILVGLSSPQDLQTNRFFTREFFDLARRRLTPGGILALNLPGSVTYLGPESRNLTACIRQTLRAAFPQVRLIPGDGYTILLASADAAALAPDAGEIARRFRAAALPTRFLSEFHIATKLDPARALWLESSLEGAGPAVNEDFRPLGVYYSLAEWNAMFAPRFQRFFARLEQVRLPHLLWPLAALAALLLALGGRVRRRERLGVVAAVASTGFAGMIFDLALIFAFQALYGVVFFWVGLLVTAFMAGSALGGLGGTRLVGRLRGVKGWFLGAEAALALFAAALPLAVRALGGSDALGGAAVQSLFLALSLLAGVLIGLEFPLACRIHLGADRGAGTTAGSLYAADLVGGWAGGILGGVLLLPVLGLGATCLAVALLKAASLAVAARTLPGAARG